MFIFHLKENICHTRVSNKRVLFCWKEVEDVLRIDRVKASDAKKIAVKCNKGF